MNKCLSKALVTLMFLLCLTEAASALDIAVCVTMPKIPGVNAPLIEEETRIPPTDSANTQETQTALAKASELQKAPQQQAPVIIQQDSQLTTTNEQPLIMVRTLYER